MKLFTISITTGPHTGKELVGYTKPLTPNDLESMLPDDEKRSYIGTLSDITEEQAEKWGFGINIALIQLSPKTHLWSAVCKEIIEKQLSTEPTNILLILVTNEK